MIVQFLTLLFLFIKDIMENYVSAISKLQNWYILQQSFRIVFS